MPSHLSRRVCVLAAGGTFLCRWLPVSATVPHPRARALTTVDAVVDGLAALLAPAVIADIATTPNDRLIEYERGIRRLVLETWGDWPLAASLARQLRAEGVTEDELSGYFLSAMARRQRGVPLQVEEQMVPFRRWARWQADQDARRKAEQAKLGIVVTSCDPFELLDHLDFARGSAALSPVDQSLAAGMARYLVGRPDLLLTQLLGRAAASEPDPAGLSLRRAQAAKDAMVAAGCNGPTLAALGLGHAFSDNARSRADRRVNLVILRRALPALPPAQ